MTIKPRNPIAKALSHGANRARREKPGKGKGSFKRNKRVEY